MRFFIAVLLLFLPVRGYSADPPDRFMVEAQNILDQIKLQNKYRNGYVSLFVGAMQIATPQSEDPLMLNSESIVPVVGAEGDLRIWNEWGFTFKISHAQNMLGPTSTNELHPNGTSAYQQMLEACLRYKFILDETNVKNFVLVKLGNYSMSNNFELFSTNLPEKPNGYMKAINAVQLGVERSIPATPQFDIKGGLDVFYVYSSDSDTTTPFKKTGSGFQFKGEVHYNFKMFGVPAKWGGGYTLGVFYNRLASAQAESDTGHTSLVQSYRTLSTILSVIY